MADTSRCPCTAGRTDRVDTDCIRAALDSHLVATALLKTLPHQKLTTKFTIVLLLFAQYTIQVFQSIQLFLLEKALPTLLGRLFREETMQKRLG